MSRYSELKRRNVLRASALYIGAAWALAQGLAPLFPPFGVPEWIMRGIDVATLIAFPFAMAFAWFYEFTSRGLRRESGTDQAPSIAAHTRKKLDRSTIVVLALAVVLPLTNQIVLHRGNADEAGQRDSTAPASIPEKSIAVLPLAHDSDDPGQRYFSDGISEDLITALSQFDALKVISCNSAFQFLDRRGPCAAPPAGTGFEWLDRALAAHDSDIARLLFDLFLLPYAQDPRFSGVLHEKRAAGSASRSLTMFVSAGWQSGATAGRARCRGATECWLVALTWRRRSRENEVSRWSRPAVAGPCFIGGRSGRPPSRQRGKHRIRRSRRPRSSPLRNTASLAVHRARG